MGRYWKLMGQYNAETTAYSALAGTFGASPYTPTSDGRLLALRTIVSHEDATTLTEGVQFKLTCDKFTPNSIECQAIGNGLHTAPAFSTPQTDWLVDQPVEAGVPITIEARNITAETPVGIEVNLWGLFES